MNIDIKNAVEQGITFLMEFKNEEITEEVIDNYTNNEMNRFRQFLNEPIASELEIEQINAILKSRLMHRVYKSDANLIDKGFKPWFKMEKENIELKYWDRYEKYLRKDKKFTNNIINNVDDVTDDITDLIGNPKNDESFQRRGLVIGDVQSGKTSNFIGLMCKASDVGYKLIVVLAGTSNELRKQTQSRIDEGLIGYDSDLFLKKEIELQPIGAGKYGKDGMRPVTGTTLSEDFNSRIAKQLGLSLNQANESIVLVVKKNVTVLNNLNRWLKGLNSTNSNGKINHSILVIDDEADYASINTNKEENDPTKTNLRIKELLQLFTKASYVGFTATPYANIFIEPPTINDMQTADLFPKDYIYCLDAPTNYIGARNLFSDDEDKNDKDVKIELIPFKSTDPNSIYNILPLKHKKDASFSKIPNSLKIAIQEFFIGNVIRDLRGENTAHRSMLINISRFIMIHEKVQKQVESYVNSLLRSIRYCSKLSNEWKNDENMYDLFLTYEYEFSKKCEDREFAKKLGIKPISWDDIRNHLYKSTSPIQVRIVNQKTKDSMDFFAHKTDGLRVIAIGGIALSRGLTLEGLMVSYFYRNSSTYDTLMQMGRWFGYRDGYKDLCRIWMTDDIQEGYISINRATEELRESIIQYKNSGLTPMDFGLRVRTDSNLLITARNKMRSTSEKLMECSLSSKIIETKYIDNDLKKIQDNYDITKQFVKKLLSEHDIYYNQIVSNSKGFKNVNYEEIINFISNLKISCANIEFDNDAIINFIKDNSNKLANWDIAFAQGNSKEKIDLNKYKIQRPQRAIDIKPNSDLIRISKQRCRVGGPSDGLFGLSEQIKETINSNKENKSVSQIMYFQTSKRNPLLTIYFLDCSKNDDINQELDEKLQEVMEFSKKVPIVAISIGIPNLGSGSKMIKYRINRIEEGLYARKIDFEEDYDDVE